MQDTALTILIILVAIQFFIIIHLFAANGTLKSSLVFEEEKVKRYIGLYDQLITLIKLDEERKQLLRKWINENL